MIDWLTEAEAACEAATEGPWQLVTKSGVHRIIGPHHPAVGNPSVAFQCTYGRGIGHEDFIEECQATAEFIALSRTALPRAIAIIRAADELARMVEGGFAEGPSLTMILAAYRKLRDIDH